MQCREVCVGIRKGFPKSNNLNWTVKYQQVPGGSLVSNRRQGGKESPMFRNSEYLARKDKLNKKTGTHRNLK